MQTTFKLFQRIVSVNSVLVLCFLCLTLSLLSGCGSGVPSLTPAEKAEVDQIIQFSGRNALETYLRAVRYSNEDEKRVLKYCKYFVSQGADIDSGLNIAIWHENIEIVKLLVSKGANVNKALDTAKSHLNSLKQADYSLGQEGMISIPGMERIPGTEKTEQEKAAEAAAEAIVKYLSARAGRR